MKNIIIYSASPTIPREQQSDWIIWPRRNKAKSDPEFSEILEKSLKKWDLREEGNPVDYKQKGNSR